jgi:hypothetical protein
MMLLSESYEKNRGVEAAAALVQLPRASKR